MLTVILVLCHRRLLDGLLNRHLLASETTRIPLLSRRYGLVGLVQFLPGLKWTYRQEGHDLSLPYAHLREAEQMVQAVCACR